MLRCETSEQRGDNRKSVKKWTVTAVHFRIIVKTLRCETSEQRGDNRKSIFKETKWKKKF